MPTSNNNNNNNNKGFTSTGSLEEPVSSQLFCYLKDAAEPEKKKKTGYGWVNHHGSLRNHGRKGIVGSWLVQPV